MERKEYIEPEYEILLLNSENVITESDWVTGEKDEEWNDTYSSVNSAIW